MKPRRFFFHYRKQTGTMTLHWEKKCLAVKNIICNVPVETKWNKSQPHVVMRGFANDITIENDCATIN